MLALACNHIMLTYDSSSSVALPEVPLLAVLPGTAGLTRVTDKRKVRRDRADVFCSTEEGVKGRRAREWGLVDEVVANSRFDAAVQECTREFAERSSRPAAATGWNSSRSSGPLPKTVRCSIPPSNSPSTVVPGAQRFPFRGPIRHRLSRWTRCMRKRGRSLHAACGARTG